MEGGIYAIVHKATGRLYIGSTINFVRRWAEHVKELNSGVHCNRKLKYSWAKYGAKAFEFTIVQEVENNGLIEWEQFWIDKLNPHFNLAKIAGSVLGHKHTEQSLEKMRLAQKGRVHNVEGMLAFWKDEAKRQALMIKRVALIRQARCKTYHFVSNSGEYVEVYNLAKFCQERHLREQRMREVCQGKRGHHKGWKSGGENAKAARTPNAGIIDKYEHSNS